MTATRLIGDLSRRTVDDAARIWAQATAARDHDPDVAPLTVARTAITGAIGESGDVMLLSAVDGDGGPVGFALAVALGRSLVELRLLGVTPAAWGQGVATALLEELAVAVRARGASAMQLWVYEANARAVAVYERSGWRHDGVTRTHPQSGRIMRLYIRSVADATGTGR